eukprot:scaffold1307_cov200-Pinguiococcus_pyrenoidosus.AAC.60
MATRQNLITDGVDVKIRRWKRLGSHIQKLQDYCHEHSPRFREAPARKMLRSLSQEEVVAVARADMSNP